MPTWGHFACRFTQASADRVGVTSCTTMTLAEAIVDRVLENGRLLLLDGQSYRIRHRTDRETHRSGRDQLRCAQTRRLQRG